MILGIEFRKGIKSCKVDRNERVVVDIKLFKTLALGNIELFKSAAPSKQLFESCKVFNADKLNAFVAADIKLFKLFVLGNIELLDTCAVYAEFNKLGAV